MGTNSQTSGNDTNDSVSFQKEKPEMRTEVEWGNDFSEKPLLNLKVGPVTERELFQFAKRALIVIAILFCTIALAKIVIKDPKNEGVNEVWDYASVALNTIVSLIFGFYFGANKKAG